MSNIPLPKPTLEGGVDSSPEAIAALVDRLVHYGMDRTTFMLCRQAAALLELVAKQREEARAVVRASDAANQIGGLVGASAHDLHLDMERRLAERAVKWKERAESASRQLAEARAVAGELYTAAWEASRVGADLDDGELQDLLIKLGLIELLPCRPGDEENEWGAAELYYPTDKARALLSGEPTK